MDRGSSGVFAYRCQASNRSWPMGYPKSPAVLLAHAVLTVFSIRNRSPNSSVCCDPDWPSRGDKIGTWVRFCVKQLRLLSLRRLRNAPRFGDAIWPAIAPSHIEVRRMRAAVGIASDWSLNLVSSDNWLCGADPQSAIGVVVSPIGPLSQQLAVARDRARLAQHLDAQ
jgi:hypothetical protein